MDQHYVSKTLKEGGTLRKPRTGLIDVFKSEYQSNDNLDTFSESLGATSEGVTDQFRDLSYLIWIS